MRALRIGLWSLAALAVAAAAGAAIAAATFDPAAAFGRIAAGIHRQTGRDLAASRVRMQWLPTPRLTLDGVTVSNPPGTARPAMVRVAHIEARLRWAALLGGEVAVGLEVDGADVQIEPANLRFQPEPQAAPVPAGAQADAGAWFHPVLERLDITNARLAYVDPSATRAFAIQSLHASHGAADLAGGISGVAETSAGRSVVQVWLPFQRNDFEVAATNLTFGDLYLGSVYFAGKGPDGILRATSTGLWRGRPFNAGIDLGHAPTSLAEAMPFDARGMGIEFKGTLANPGELRGVDATLTVESEDAAGWSGLLGAPVPAVHDLRLEAHVIDPAGLRAGIALRALHATAREGDVAGDLALGWAGRLSVRGTLNSTRLDLDALALAPAPSAASPPPPQAAPPAAAGPVAVPAPAERALPFAALQAGDADLALAAQNITVGGMTLPRAEGRLMLRDGRMRLDPAVVLTPGGPIAGAATAEAEPPRVGLDLHAAGLRLAGLTDQVHGAADLDVSLTASGATLGALEATLDGHAGLALIDGDIANALLSAALAEPLRAAHIDLDVRGRTAVSCLALRIDATARVATVGTLLLESARVDIEGGGTADLAQRNLALQLRPTLHLGAASVATPLLVGGPFGHPTVRMDPQNGRVGLSIGSAADSPDCAPALLAARGHAGPLPAAAASDARPRRPFDLLRGFVR